MSNNLQSHIAEGEQIRNAIQTASTRCTELRRQTEQLQRDVETGLRAPAEYAVQGVHMLCCTVENLYDGTHNSVVVRSVDTQKLVRVCKGEAAVVAQRFKTLHDKSTEMTQRAGAVSPISSQNPMQVVILSSHHCIDSLVWSCRQSWVNQRRK